MAHICSATRLNLAFRPLTTARHASTTTFSVTSTPNYLPPQTSTPQTAPLQSAPLSTPVSGSTSVSISGSSPSPSRSWNVVRYHPDLKQALQYVPQTSLPTVYRPTDVLVRVLASSVNPLDVAMTRGYGNVLLSLANIVTSTGVERGVGGASDRLPLTLGRDFVGQIVARGQEVSNFKHGDLVWGTVPPYEKGAHAYYVITSESAVAHKPKNLSNVDAASIPYVGLTAWSAITNFGELNAQNAYNKKVLILGGSGGVGCFAVQLLKYWGAEVTTTASASSLNWLRSVSGATADECIDYRDTERFLASYPGTFDFILDASSSSAAKRNYELLSAQHAKNQSMGSELPRVLHPKTMYVTLTSPLLGNLDRYGVLGGGLTTVADAISDTLSGLQSGLRFRWAYYLPNPKALLHIGDLVERGAIKPLTTTVYEFDRALEAYESLEKGRPRNGKVVLSNA